ncbi:hypothetical protein ACIODW_03435 [Streptomyces sp. NPDC087897]|uniref:hypothetical protein n=1 Tax=Streptomyces sp. NPDC087897 TaxID=3365817 RepID=UPI003821AB58
MATTGERTTTHEGGAGHLRDAESELFLLAVGNFVGTDTFYERGGATHWSRPSGTPWPTCRGSRAAS